METIWFWLVAVMVTAYVVLDGFDIGAGIIYRFVTRSDAERRLVLRTIGPVWDGNEVWLLSAGGTLYFAFPVLYASSFSGFYLPLHMVLWLLIMRGIGIEFRMHLAEPVWRGFFDGVFMISSVLLAIFFGAALGNVVRGVPLGADGFFFAPLWTNWRVGPNPGILDWYTVMCALIALCALALHGALYVATKTEGEVHERSRSVVYMAWPFLLALTFISLIATLRVLPHVTLNYRNYPVALIIPMGVFAALAAILHFHNRRREKAAFLSSAAYLALMLVGAAFALYPNVLPASTGPERNLTIYNTMTGPYSLKGGLVWWTLGMCLAIGYFVFIYRMFRGKVTLKDADSGHGY